MEISNGVNIGITGSNGFIGKHIVAALKKKENIKLSLFDLPKNNLFDFETVKKFVRNKDIIIHTAAVNRGTDTEIIAGSIVATYNLISAMAKSKIKTKLIFLSSIQAETETLYGLSKRLTETMLADFSQRFKIPVTIFRMTNVFGEGCRPFYNSVVATFCYQAVNNQKLKIDIDRKIKFIYVKDLVKILIKQIAAKRKQLFYFKRIVLRNEILVSKLVKLIQSFKELPSLSKLKNKFQKDLYRTYLSYGK